MKATVKLVLCSMILAACSAAPSATSENVPLLDNPPVDEMVVEEAAEVVLSPEAEPASVENASYGGPAWASLPLTDARTGATFTLADFAGKTVYVEPMATWCSQCLAQQNIVRETIPQLDADSFVFISLSVENNMTPSALAEYAERSNFGWTFTVGTQELLTGISETFGRSALVPPSTPHFVIAPDGTLSDLSTGRHSSQQIIDQLTALSGA